MNGTYFKNSDFPNNLNSQNSYQDEQHYNPHHIFKKNTGKKVKIYATFEESNEWRDRMLSGIIEELSDYYLVISDPVSGNWYLIPTRYINYVEFEEKINY